MSTDRESFFIGWTRAPADLRAFLVACAVGLFALFAAAGYLVAATMDDPGSGAFRFDWGRQSVIARLEARPYPVLHVIESERFPAGTTLLLSGNGKRGVQARADPLDGQVVRAAGVMIARGDLAMMQLADGEQGLAPAPEASGPVPAKEPLGRWRLTGEICDGKCYAGAMRPGRGLAHRACANLCLIGGVPPVFVSTDAVHGERFLLMADAAGGPVTDALLDHVATLVQVEGDVERRGSVLVLRIAPETLRLAP